MWLVRKKKRRTCRSRRFPQNPRKYKSTWCVSLRLFSLKALQGQVKLLLAKAVAGEADVPFFSISGSDFVEMFCRCRSKSCSASLLKKTKKAELLLSLLMKSGCGLVTSSWYREWGGGNDEREQNP